MPNRSTIPALALAALSLSACGSSSSSSSGHTSHRSKADTPAPSLSAFKTGFAKDKAQFTALGRSLGAAIQGASKKSNAELGSEFKGLAARTVQQQAQLRKLNPPPRYKGRLDELITAFGSVAGDLEAVAAATGSNDAARARKAATSLVQHSAGLKTVDLALTRALGLPQTP